MLIALKIAGGLFLGGVLGYGYYFIARCAGSS